MNEAEWQVSDEQFKDCCKVENVRIFFSLHFLALTVFQRQRAFQTFGFQSSDFLLFFFSLQCDATLLIFVFWLIDQTK